MYARCNLRPGDFMASGTISGSEKYSFDPAHEYVPGAQRDSYGSLMEMTWKGKHPLQLKNGESRVFFQDGDKAIMHGKCDNGKIDFGFGECSARVLPPKPSPYIK